MSDHNRRTAGRGRARRLVGTAILATAVVGVALGVSPSSVASTTASTAATSSIALPAGSYVPSQLLVRYVAGTTPAAASRVNASVGASTVRSYSSLVPGLQLVQLRPGLSTSAALTGYAQQAAVRYAQPNWITHIQGAKPAGKFKTPNDPSYPQQWDWPKIGAPMAWKKTTGSKTIVVTDIDTGMDYTHEDLAANAWRNKAECNGKKGVDDDKNGYVDDCYGIDPIDGDTDPIDDNGHGTHTAGTIGAVGNNKVGVTGMNWTVRVMPCKSHDSSGSGSVSAIIECYQYAAMEKVKYGYDVVSTNNSYGGCPEACDDNPATYDAIEAMIKPGIVMAFAAGNSARDNDVRPNFPSNYDLPNIIAVAATDANDSLAGFSEYGLRSVDVGAPGVNVLSTLPNNSYGSLSGTSMATPHVAAEVALLHAGDKKLDWWQIRNLIIAGGQKISALDGKTVSGRRIDLTGSMSCSATKVLGLLSPVANTGAGEQTVSALNILCARPVSNVTITVSPGNKSLKLVDDGKGPDLVKGDGIYATDWTPKCDTNYTLTISGGDKYKVDVVACAKLDKKSGAAGSSIKVTGSGYTASEVVDIFFDDVLLDTVDADSKGKVADTVKVPKSAKKGDHTVTVSGQTSGMSATATFTVK